MQSKLFLLYASGCFPGLLSKKQRCWLVITKIRLLYGKFLCNLLSNRCSELAKRGEISLEQDVQLQSVFIFKEIISTTPTKNCVVN